MIKEIQFQNNYDAAKDANRTGAYVALRYDTQKKTLSVVDKFGNEKTNIIAADGNEDSNIQNLKDQVVKLINKDEQFKQFLLQTLKETEEKEKIEKNDYSSFPLTFKSNGNSILKISIADEDESSMYYGSFCYKLNNNIILKCSKTQTFNLIDGDVISFYGAWFMPPMDYFPPQILFQINEGDIDVFGNVNSLQNFSNLSIYGAKDYISLAKFKGIKDASKIILPPILMQNCFVGMFKDCKELTATPSLPATVAPGCYKEMFRNCQKINSIILPAHELLSNCYQSMFNGCKNLNRIEVNFTQWSKGRVVGATTSWVSNVASKGTFIKPTALQERFGTSYIPTGWTVINKD